MNSLSRLMNRVSFLQEEKDKLENERRKIEKNKRTANFNRLEFALKKHDMDRAKKIAADLGLANIVEMDVIHDIIRAHQSGAGTQLRKVNVRRRYVGKVAGRLSRSLRKRNRKVRMREIPANWILTEKDRLGGGRNKVRPAKVVEQKKWFMR